MEINHFSHEHPLVLSEEKRSRSFGCGICRESIFGLSYCCKICPYVLHKWCAELPHELSFIHEYQNLILTRIESSREPSLCKICDHPIEQLAFAYTTTNESSSGKIHVECASFPVELLIRCDRRLTVWKEDESCSICQIKDDFPKLLETGVENSYCHIHCAALPRMVKHSVHLHELTLRPPLIEDDWYFEFFCDACEKDRDPASPVYYCERCEFVAHIGCGVIGSDPPPIQNLLGTNSVYEIILSESAEDDEETEEGDYVYEEGEESHKINHFIHEHPLVLKCFKRLGMRLEETCCGCGQSIYGMTYACIEEKCDWGCFYLHKWCAHLPKTIHSSIHPGHGPLKLMESRLIENSNQDSLLVEDYSMACEFCGLDIGLMSYGCDKCDFQIHGLCALLHDDLNHESHEHTLSVVINKGVTYNDDDNDYEIPKYKLPLGSSENPLCQACGFLCEDVSLECKICNFHLHVHCFLLPNTGKHTTHRHDLSLTYTYIEDPIALEFICDTCEKPRTPNRWVYCCPDPKCYIVSHVDCVVPKYFATIEHQN